MALTGSLSMSSLPYLRLDCPPVQAECISMSWVAVLCVQWTFLTTIKRAQGVLLGRQNNLAFLFCSHSATHNTMGCFPCKAVLLTVFTRIVYSLPVGTITLA